MKINWSVLFTENNAYLTILFLLIPFPIIQKLHFNVFFAPAAHFGQQHLYKIQFMFDTRQTPSFGTIAILKLFLQVWRIPRRKKQTLLFCTIRIECIHYQNLKNITFLINRLNMQITACNWSIKHKYEFSDNVSKAYA